MDATRSLASFGRLPEKTREATLPAMGRAPYADDDLLDQVGMIVIYGGACLRALVLAIERGAATLPIDPTAWDNTMAAVEWLLSQLTAGRIYGDEVVTPDDVERARRLHLLGREALSGGGRSADLGPLAEQCLRKLVPRWRTAFAHV